MTDTIFGSEVPTLPNNADGSTQYTLGTRFTASADCQATHGRWYFPTTIPHASIQVSIGIFRNSDTTLLGSVDFPLASTLGAWNQVAFSSPINLTSGVAYTVAIWTPLRYVARGTYPWPVTSSPGSLVQTDASNAGRFAVAGSLTFPTGPGASSYFADLVLEPTSSGSTVTAAITLPALQSAAVLASSSALTAALSLPALQATASLTSGTVVSAAITLPALQSAAVLSSMSSLSAAITLPGLDMSAILSSPVAPAEATSSPNAPISTVSRPFTISTGSRGSA